MGSPHDALGDGGRPATVLLVGEDGELGRSIAGRLAAEGHRVIGADAAEDALYALMRHVVDLVVSAQRLRGLSGVELCRILRERAGPPVVLIADGDSASTRVDLLDRGAAGCVERRDGPDPVAARIAALVRRTAG